MSDGKREDAGSVLDELGFDLVADLERQSLEGIQKMRAYERLEVKLTVFVQPGNSSDLQRFRAKGFTADISAGGARLFLPLPLTPGDIFRIEFDSKQIELPMVFGRCLRCRLVREGTFESGLIFFNKISLSGFDPSRVS